MTREEKSNIEKLNILSFLKYFKKNKLDYTNRNLMGNLQKFIQTIFQIEISELGYNYNPDKPDQENDILLKFVNFKESAVKGQLRPGKKIQQKRVVYSKPRIRYNTAQLYAGLDSEKADVRILAVKELVCNVLHEIQHVKQYLQTDEPISSIEAISFARDETLRRYLESKWYSREVTSGNYEEYFIENEANEKAFERYLEIMGKDKEIEVLRDIEIGNLSVNRYKVDVNSKDGQTHYKSKGLQERDDATVPILDDLIGRQGKIEILKLYPILQKEYNMDGTKKSAIVLMNIMQREENDILEKDNISHKEKTILIKKAREMYYELIFKELEKSSVEELRTFSSIIGKNETKRLVKQMKQYFQSKMKTRIEHSKKRASLQDRNNIFVPSSNIGEIKNIPEGNMVTINEFINTLDPDLRKQKVDNPIKGLKPLSKEQLLKLYGFKYLPSNGIVTLKDGTKISVKQYTEQYLLQNPKIGGKHLPYETIKDTMQSACPWEIHYQIEDGLKRDYKEKKEFLVQFEKITVGRFKNKSNIVENIPAEHKSVVIIENSIQDKKINNKARKNEEVPIEPTDKGITPNTIKRDTNSLGLKELNNLIINLKSIEEKESMLQTNNEQEKDG